MVSWGSERCAYISCLDDILVEGVASAVAVVGGGVHVLLGGRAAGPHLVTNLK